MQTLLAVVISAVFGFLASMLFRTIAWRCNVLNYPNPIVPQHTRPVAYLGGAAIAAATIAVLVSFQPGREWLLAHREVIIAAVLMLAVGTLDDLHPLSPAAKFAAQSAVAITAVMLGAMHAFTGVSWIDAILSWFWIVTVVNAFNLTDVCDGLVGGLGAITFLAIALLFDAHAFPAFVAAGACAGFLAVNLPDASMYLGDGGSHFLGALVAIMLLVAPESPGAERPVPMILIAGIPLFELSFLVFVRRRKGLKWWRGSPDHLALRLQRAGLSKLGADIVVWSAAVMLVALAAIARRWGAEPLVKVSLLALFFAESCIAGWFLVRVDESSPSA